MSSLRGLINEKTGNTSGQGNVSNISNVSTGRHEQHSEHATSSAGLGGTPSSFSQDSNTTRGHGTEGHNTGTDYRSATHGSSLTSEYSDRSPTTLTEDPTTRKIGSATSTSHSSSQGSGFNASAGMGVGTGQGLASSYDFLRTHSGEENTTRPMSTEGPNHIAPPPGSRDPPVTTKNNV